jgi:hypothetical protein
MSDIFVGLRRLSQERKVCLITASQADANAMDKATLSVTNFSDDKCKVDHVTCMIGLNQTPAEKEQGIMRVNKIVSRTQEFNPEHTITVLQDLYIVDLNYSFS